MKCTNCEGKGEIYCGALDPFKKFTCAICHGYGVLPTLDYSTPPIYQPTWKFPEI